MPRSFLRELKRRKVYRVAVAYAIVGWLLIQIATQVFPFFHIPDWSVRLLVLLVLAGFPVALVLAWAFDATPHGIVRTETQGQPVLRRAQHGTLAVAIIGVLIALAGGGGYWWWHRSAAPAQPVAGATSAPVIANATLASAVIPEKSIAVLPLTNESGDKDQQYFSDGLSEDLITALSQFAGLKVINRDSSFRFRDSRDDIKTIGAKLGVAHLLEGSVQRAGGMVRISAELVNAADGSTLWSQRYDRPYTDLFKLQDDITQAVAAELKAKLLTGDGAATQSDRPPNGSLVAYNDLLQGKFYAQRGDSEADLRKAIGYFTDATRLDPGYALAWASMGSANAILAGNYLGGADATQAWDKARAAVHTALSLDSNLAYAHSANVFILTSADHDWTRAEIEAERAYRLDPDKDFFALATARGALGQAQQAVDLIRQGLPSDPLCTVCYDYLARYLPALGRFDEAAQAGRKALQLSPEFYFTRVQLAYIAAMRGDTAAALQAAQQQPPSDWRDLAIAVALQIGNDRAAADQALQAVIAKQAGYAAYQIAEIYALRHDPDNMFKWLERASANRDPGITLMLTDPPVLRYKNDPRFAAFCKKVGLPVPGEATVSASSTASL